MPGLCGFPRQNRLTTATDYQRVFSGSNRLSDRYWTMLFKPNDFPHDRVGLVVSKKRAKRAVDRNRLKRLVRETFRQRTTSCSVDVVVMPRDIAAKTQSVMLQTSLNDLWRRLEKRQATKKRGGK